MIGITSSPALCTNDPVCVNGTRRTEGSNFSLAAPSTGKKRALALPRCRSGAYRVRFPDEAMNFIIKRARESELHFRCRTSEIRAGASEDPRWISGFRAPGSLLFLFRFNSLRDPPPGYRVRQMAHEIYNRPVIIVK